MDLPGPHLDTLVKLLKDAFDRNSLKQTVRVCLNEDMYKEWVNPNQSLKDDLYELLPKLASMGLLAILLDRVAIERAHLAEQLTELRLVIGIKTTSTEDQTSAIHSGVTSVANKMQFPAVRALVSQSRDVLTDLADRIKLLGDYKNLHDELHDARMQHRSFQRAVIAFSKDSDALGDFTDAVMLLEAVATDIDKIYGGLPTQPDDVQAEEGRWIKSFTMAVELARQAADQNDSVTAKESQQAIRRILITEPSRIDSLLRSTAKKMALARLKDIFTSATALPELAGEAGMLEEGRIATEQLLRQIQTQVDQHADWQEIDRGLDGSDEYLKKLAEDPSDFDALWRGLKKGIQPLMAMEPESLWAVKVGSSLASVDAARAAGDWPKLNTAFTRFRQDATTQFVSIDKRLKKLAEGVNSLGTPLRNLLIQP